MGCVNSVDADVEKNSAAAHSMSCRSASSRVDARLYRNSTARAVSDVELDAALSLGPVRLRRSNQANAMGMANAAPRPPVSSLPHDAHRAAMRRPPQHPGGVSPGGHDFSGSLSQRSATLQSQESLRPGSWAPLPPTSSSHA